MSISQFLSNVIECRDTDKLLFASRIILSISVFRSLVCILFQKIICIMSFRLLYSYLRLSIALSHLCIIMYYYRSIQLTINQCSIYNQFFNQQQDIIPKITQHVLTKQFHSHPLSCLVTILCFMCPDLNSRVRRRRSWQLHQNGTTARLSKHGGDT